MRKFQGNKLVVATHNEGKLDEVRALFASKSVEILSSKSLDLPEPVSYTHLTLPTIYSV